MTSNLTWMASRQSGESRALRSVLRNHAEGYALLCFHFYWYSVPSYAHETAHYKVLVWNRKFIPLMSHCMGSSGGAWSSSEYSKVRVLEVKT